MFLSIDPAAYSAGGSRTRCLPSVFSTRLIHEASETTNGRQREVSRLSEDATTRSVFSENPCHHSKAAITSVIVHYRFLPHKRGIRSSRLAVHVWSFPASRVHLLPTWQKLLFTCPQM